MSDKSSDKVPVAEYIISSKYFCPDCKMSISNMTHSPTTSEELEAVGFKVVYEETLGKYIYHREVEEKCDPYCGYTPF